MLNLSIPDLVNASFEMLGGFVILLNIRRILQDKLVRGVDWRVTGFFSLWGAWNLFYYPHLGQVLSLAAGVWIMLANTCYLIILIFYVRKER